MRALILLLVGCAGDPPEAPVEQPGVAPMQGEVENFDQGQKHPPLPADNPMWDWDAGGFVPDFAWYGEANWADVRMRVAGHLSVAGRDRARLAASRGDMALAAERYGELAAQLDAIEVPAEGIAGEILGLLRAAAHRDQATLQALSERRVPELEPGLDGLRARVYGRILGGEDPTLAQDIAPFLELREDLELESFTDFKDRHRLRVRLFEAYLDSLDPLTIDEPWGYWDAGDLVFRARALERGALQPPGSLLGISALVQAPARPFTVEGLGRLPTGDSLIDVGAEPGPLAIGTLMKLGLDDPEHRAWLEAAVERLNAAPMKEVPGITAELEAELDAHGHGSRYYNIKQLRNEAVRVLAHQGRPDLALEVLERNWPLHNQDWACPNRQGILLALKGRLQAQAGLAEAEATLAASVKEALDFLALVDAVERGEQVGVRPPRMGPGRGAGPQGPPTGGGKGPPQGAPPQGPPPRR